MNIRILLLIIGMVGLLAGTTHAEVFVFQKALAGRVESVRPNLITLTEDGGDEGNGNTVSLEVNDQTTLKAVSTITDLREGDEVNVKYTEDAGRKIAVVVEKSALEHR